MKYHKQAFLHDPDNGQYGDCYRTALACILNLERDDVPHFMHDDPPVEEFNVRIAAFLRDHGLKRLTFGYECELQVLLDWMKEANPNTLYLIGGRSPRGTHHMTVAYNDHIIHDPHPVGGGLVAPCDGGSYWIDLFVPLAIHGQDIAA